MMTRKVGTCLMAGALACTLMSASSAATNLITIDPWGTTGPVAWTVHASSANIRSAPSSSGSILGSIANGGSVSGAMFLVTETDQEWLKCGCAGAESWISATTINRVHPGNAVSGNLPIGSEIISRYWGVPLAYTPTDLVTLAPQYTTQEAGKVYKLRADAYNALATMLNAAQAQGVTIVVGSAHRSGASQKSIYDNAVATSGLAQRYSAPPGHSEHQLGVAVDFSDPAMQHFLTASFGNTPQGIWLRNNALNYGWAQSYRPDNLNETGYIEESWHYRYWGSFAPVNKVTNADFEGTFTGGIANGWTSFVLSGTPTFGRATVNKQSGVASQYWARTDTAVFNAGVYQRIPVTPGRRYEIVSWMKRQSLIAGTSMFFGYDLTGGTNPSSATVSWWDLTPGADNTWLQYKLVVDNASSNFITVFAKGGHTGTTGGTNSYFYVDNVIVRDYGRLYTGGGSPTPTVTPSPTATATPSPSPSPTATPTVTPSPTPNPNNLVLNGSMESGASSGLRDNWTGWTKSGSNVITFGRASLNKYDGTYSQYWARTDSLAFTGAVYQRITVVPGATYRLKAFMKRQGTVTSGGTTRFGYDLTGGTNPEAASVNYTTLSAQETWAAYDRTFTATGNTVTVFGYSSQTSGSNNYYYLDAVDLRQQ